MKRVVSFVLSLAMLTSVFAPLTYAENALPVDQSGVVELVQELPAEPESSSSTDAAEPESSSSTDAAEPESSSSADTAEPESSSSADAAEPESSSSTDTAEPESSSSTDTAEPESSSSTDTAEPESVPDENKASESVEEPQTAEVPEDDAKDAGLDDIDPETTLVLYYDEASGYYYGRVPVQPGESGAKLATNFYLHDESGYTFSGESNRVIVLDGEYWMFVKPYEGDAFEPASVMYYDEWALRTPGTTTEQYRVDLPVAVTTGAPEQVPPLMFTGTQGSVSMNTTQNISPLTQYDTPYEIKVSFYNEGNEIVYVSGEGGIEVTQPDANNTFTVTFPSDVEFVLPNGDVAGTLWIYTMDANGNLDYRETGLYYAPGRDVDVSYLETWYWADLLSEEGMSIEATMYDGSLGTTIRGWANLGTPIADQITATLKSYDGDLSDKLTVVYDEQAQRVIVKLSETPDTSVNWTLSLRVPCEEGYTLCMSSIVSKNYTYPTVEWDGLTLGDKQGSTLTGTLTEWDSNLQDYVPVTPGGEWTVRVDYASGIQLESGTTAADYFEASFDASTGKVTVKTLRDLTLTSSYPQVNFVAESTLAQINFSVSSFGTPSVNWNTSVNWVDLLSDEGVLAEASVYSSQTIYGWSNFGTMNGAPTATLTQTLDGGAQNDYSSLLSASYDEAEDAVVLKLSGLPEDMSGTWSIEISMPYQEYTLTASRQIVKAYVSSRITGAGLAVLGKTQGSTMSGTIEVMDGDGRYAPLSSSEDWTVSLTCSGVTLESGEACADVFDVQIDFTTGALTATTKRDVESEQYATLSVSAESPTRRFSQSINIGAPQISVSYREGDNTWSTYTINMVEGKSYALTPYTDLNGADASLKSLGVEFEPVICRGTSYRPTEAFAGAEEYFTLTKDAAGVIHLTVDKVPPLYDYANNQQYYYALDVVPVNESFIASTGDQLNMEVNSSDMTFTLTQDGEPVVALPIKQGVYTYDFTLKQDGKEIDPAALGGKYAITSRSLYVDGSLVEKSAYDISFDLDAGAMTYTLNQDLEGTSGSLYFEAYFGDSVYFTTNLDVGLVSINFEFFGVGEGARPNRVYEFTDGLPSQFRIVGWCNGAYLPRETLRDDAFTIRAYEDYQYVPLSESEYFDASITDGVLSITVKQTPPSSNGFALEISYEDETYYGSELFTYTNSTGSAYYNINLLSLSTGSVMYNIPANATGLKQSYRVLDSDSQQKLGTLLGDDLLGFELVASNGLDVSQYVDVSYNAATSTLTFDWKAPLPLLQSNGSLITYTLRAVLAEGCTASVSQKSMFRNYISVSIPSRLAPGTRTFEVSGGQIDSGAWISVSAGAEDIAAEITPEGKLQLTISESCPDGRYTYQINGTLDNATYQFSTSGSFEVKRQTGMAYVFTTTGSAYNDGETVLEDGGNYSVSFTKDAPTTSIRPLDPAGVTDLSITGLTIGTAEKTDDGLLITWNSTGYETITLMATLEDGSTVETKIWMSVDLSGDILMYGGESAYFRDITWVAGNSYRFYPLYSGKTYAENGYTLQYAEFVDETYFRVDQLHEDGSVTITPLKACSNVSLQMLISYIDANGNQNSDSFLYDVTSVIAQGNRTNFLNVSTGSVVTAVSLEQGKSVTLRINETDIQSVEFGANVKESLTWQTDPGDPALVTLTEVYPLNFDGAYFYATVTRTDGTQTAAYVAVTDDTWRNGDTLPDGTRLVFGRKEEDGAYTTWSASSYIRGEAPITSKLYVFYRDSDNYGTDEGYQETNPIVTNLEVRSDSEQVTILRQGLENGMLFFEYQLDASAYGEFYIEAVATTAGGSEYSSWYRLRVSETPVETRATVNNGDELRQVLASATLLPGTVIRMNAGTYDGDFVCEIPCSLSGTNVFETVVNGTVHGEVPATMTSNVAISNLSFNGDGQGPAVSGVLRLTNNRFTGYDVAVELEQKSQSYTSYSIYYNTFEDNGTAIRFLTREWNTYLQGNTFRNNGVAVEFDESCVVDGAYSLAYDTVASRGSMIRNKLYLNEGQLAVLNNAANGTTVNFTYNYYNVAGVEQPKKALFGGSSDTLYSPYYDSETMDGVETSGSLEDTVDESGTSSVTLVAAQGSSSTNTADSALQLSGSKFEELRDSDKVSSMEVNVKSTSGETDVIWTFDDDKLREDYDGSSVNLGVAFTFTDFEYDMVNNIVKKSTESTEIDPDTGEPVSETLGSIAYQAMCFSHSGALPGTATVKVRMNESLLAYYAEHGNSLDGFKVYYVNSETGKLEKMDTPLTVIVEDGVYFYQLDIDHCSSYIVTNETLREDIIGFIKIMLGQGSAYELVDDMLTRLPANSLISEVLSQLTGGAMTVLNAAGEKMPESATIGTGYTIGLGDGTVAQITAVVGGDLDGDGQIDMQDLVKERRAMLNYLTLEGAYLKAGTTMSSDASVPQMSDLIRLRRVMLRLADSMYD